uniref:Uncharacterized protein n=1 Tax=Cyclopterus lumpus TaxID=8103 RepID=A0A8C3G950_CYCLU
IGSLFCPEGALKVLIMMSADSFCVLSPSLLVFLKDFHHVKGLGASPTVAGVVALV